MAWWYERRLRLALHASVLGVSVFVRTPPILLFYLRAVLVTWHEHVYVSGLLLDHVAAKLPLHLPDHI